MNNLCDCNCYGQAIKRGHFECFKSCYAQEQGQYYPNDTIIGNAAGKHGIVWLQYCHEHGWPWFSYSYVNIARDDRIDCMKYMRECGYLWDVSTCAASAKRGQLKALQYAHEHGCPWDETTCGLAARGGHLKALQYAHEHGCPWDETTCAIAAGDDITSRCIYYNKEYEVDEQGYPIWPPPIPIVGEDQLTCLRYALRCECPWNGNYSPRIKIWKRWIHILSVVRVCVKLRHMEQRQCTHRRKRVMLKELLALPCKVLFRGGKIFTHFPGGTDARKATKRYPDDDYTGERDPKRVKIELKKEDLF